MEFSVSEQKDADWPAVWRVLEPVVRAGDSYPLPLDFGEEQTRIFWKQLNGYNAVARDETGQIVGDTILPFDDITIAQAALAAPHLSNEGGQHG